MKSGVSEQTQDCVQHLQIGDEIRYFCPLKTFMVGVAETGASFSPSFASPDGNRNRRSTGIWVFRQRTQQPSAVGSSSCYQNNPGSKPRQALAGLDPRFTAGEFRRKGNQAERRQPAMPGVTVSCACGCTTRAPWIVVDGSDWRRLRLLDPKIRTKAAALAAPVAAPTAFSR